MKLRQIFAFTLLITTSVLGFGLTGSSAQAATLLTDFEGGLPGGWFSYFGASTVTTDTLIVADTDALARPGQAGDNELLEATFNVFDFGGFGQDFTSIGGAQNWSASGGVSFWMYGTSSGNTYQFEIYDNGPDAGTAERFDTLFTDDFSGWQRVFIPFTAFTRATDFQPPGAPDDGLTLTQMWGWAVPLDGNTGILYMDDIGLDAVLVDDFESGLPSGSDGDGNGIGFVTFNDPSSTIAIATTNTPPAPVPGGISGNNVMQVDSDVSGDFGFAGFIHAFENEAVDSWTPQDWSAFSGLSFWLYGNGTGSSLFIDILDNRNPGSTTDDAERFSINVIDDFSGWQFFEIPFGDFNRKEIGNGAPDDGFTLTEVHGWAFGVFNSGLAFTNYLDDVGLYGVAEIPSLEASFTSSNYDIPEGDTGIIGVTLNRPMNPDDPAEVSIDYATDISNAIAGRDYIPVSGTLTFVNGGSSELSFPLETIDNNKHTGDKRVILRLSDPVDVAAGLTLQATAAIIDDEPYDPLLVDDFESYPYLWWADSNVLLDNPEIAADDDDALPGQGAYEGVLMASVPLHVDIDVQGRVCNQGSGVIPVVLLSTDTFDATTVDHTTVTLGDASETHSDKKTGVANRHVEDADGDGDMDLVFHFRFSETGLECDPLNTPFNGWTYDGQPITADDEGASFGRNFALGRDWSAYEGLTFWYYGQNTGDVITVDLLDNRAPDPGPVGWSLMWSDEFDEPAGTPPDAANWEFEIGDGALNGIPGWGNSELQYYTDSTGNAATDGAGNLHIVSAEADGSLMCYYGPCEYTSARLLTRNRAEFAYGRIEARILLPDGEDGLWPAFWSLGTDINQVGWPQTGEIDFMEYVSRLPNEIFGTIHGPGYSGGASFGNVYDFGQPASDEFHEFVIEWEPDLIRWYVDGFLYHVAEPVDVAPNEWVFNDPIFMLLNQAVGGNFGGAVSDDLVFPQTLVIDYVRVFQGPDTAERFESSFVDNFSGWQELSVPFASFSRSADQPAGAPDDGLGLNEVWGYGFTLPDGGSTSGSLMLDQVRLPAPPALTVVNLDDDGPGSLRWAAGLVATGGIVTFDPALAGGTIGLTSGPLAIGKAVTIDGSGAPGIAVSGSGIDRVLIVDAGADVMISSLAVINGFGWQLAGGILNNGNLTLDHVTVSDNTMATDAGDFWQGGGGIYNGDGATLVLVDSTVSNNSSGWSGGGIYSFFNTTIVVMRSTISGNVAGDVGGGLRTLGNATIDNSTLSGNTSTAWHGGAAFSTDGVVDVSNSTVTGNIAPGGTAGGLFLGTFGPGNATLNLQNTIVAGNGDFGCFLAPFGAGIVAINSLGNSVYSDGTCFPVGSDQVVGDAGLGPLSDNGGPTMTHALLPGSPAKDTADNAFCPAVDQRGEPRDDGACDGGAFEVQ
jgi:beta-glucanase (GH16 family)